MKIVYLHSNKGSIFLLSLWALVFLSLLAFLSGAMVQQQIIALRKIEERIHLYDIAEAGILVAVEAISSSQERDLTPSIDSLNDFWADDQVLFKEKELKGGTFSVCYEEDGQPIKQQKKRYGIIDENRKININYVPEDILIGVFSVIGGLDLDAARALARSVIDWRDEDDNKTGSETNASEGFEYRNSGYAYTPQNKAFSTIEELLFVRGMNSNIFARIRNNITVYSSGKINVNTAPEAVFMSMGFDAGLTKKILTLRSGENRIEGDFDDHLFASPGALYKDLSSYYEVSKREATMIAYVASIGLIDVSSNTFQAQSISRLDTGSMYGKITCIFDKNGAMRYWSTYYTQEEAL